jgi:hypothetical protein
MRWTQEDINIAIRLSAEGKSAADIAKRFGDWRTRNAVIGMIHRTRIKAGYKPHTIRKLSDDELQARRILKRMKRRETRKAKRTFVREQNPPPPAPVIARQYALVSTRKPLSGIPSGGFHILDLPRRGCRFAITPHNIRSHRFCGLPRDGKSSYCAEHRKIVTRVLEIRK